MIRLSLHPDPGTGQHWRLSLEVAGIELSCDVAERSEPAMAIIEIVTPGHNPDGVDVVVRWRNVADKPQILEIDARCVRPVDRAPRGWSGDNWIWCGGCQQRGCPIINCTNHKDAPR
jgi:hypothetical protein